MNFALSFNKKYVNFAIVTITSICENNSGHHDIYVLHAELDDGDISFIRDALEEYDVSIIPLEIDIGEYKDRLPISEFWSYEIYHRLFLSQVLPESVDRILYLDVDTIVHGPLDELYYVNFEGADLCACYDSNDTLKLTDMSEMQQKMFGPLIAEGYKYFNSGILLMNIGKLRGRVSFETYIDAMKEWDFQMTAPDQDILNYVHHSKVKYADYRKYDLFARNAYNNGWCYEDVLRENVIVHYAGSKPWECKNTHYSIEKLWWDYAVKTAVYMELLEGFLESALCESFLENEALRLSAEKEQLDKALDEAGSILKKLGISMEEDAKA
jgi:lipopolysaccharide biosynthesis glycosyltransferase